MPKHFKAARLWTLVAAVALVAGTVSALGHAGTEGARFQPPLFATAI